MATRRGAFASIAGLIGSAALLALFGQRFRSAVAAYIYGYPLVTMEMTRRVMTNVAAVTPMRAPMGQFVRARTYPDETFRDAPAPNADTLYTSAWLDVGAEPWILSVPDMGKRYCLFPMLDAWTNVFASPGTRTTGTAAQAYAITGPGWNGILPFGVTECRSPTSIVWILGRIYCTGTEEDYAAVHALQDRCTLVPLSAYGSNYTPSASPTDPNLDMESGLRQVVNRLSAVDFFALLADLLKTNPPSLSDRPMLTKLAQLGIVPGRELDRSKLDVPVLGLVPRAGIARAALHFRFSGGDMARRNGWTWTTKAGRYGTNYNLRALIAIIGLGANGPEDALYAVSNKDAGGGRLDGRHRYLIRFAPGQLPPARAFWSITLYDERFYLVADPIRRYAVNARQNLVASADGSIPIHIQVEPPEGDTAANWLPAPHGNFQLMLRIYWPRDTAPSILDGSWIMPVVEKIG